MKLNSYSLGFNLGSIACKSNHDIHAIKDALSKLPDSAKKGFIHGYLLSVPFERVSDNIKSLIMSYRLKPNGKTFCKIIDCQNTILADSMSDSDNYTIYGEGDDLSVGLHYDKEDLPKVKKLLSEDDSLEIKSDDENGVIVGSKDPDGTVPNGINDSEEAEYTLDKVNNNHYKVLKDGVPTYDLEKKSTRWTCSCTGFKYRGRCKHIGLLQDILPKRHPRAEIDAFVPELKEIFDKDFDKWEIVGSYRRKKSTFKDIDILVECSKNEFPKVKEQLEDDPNYVNTMSGSDIVRGTYHGYDLDVTRVNQGEWGSYLLYRTGSAKFNMQMRALAKKKGYRLNEHGLFDGKGALLARDTEEDIFTALGMPYVAPEDRDL